MKSTLTAFLMLCCTGLFAQSSTNPLTFSGYIETYYSYDFNRPFNGERTSFLYNFNQHNEFNLNLGYIKAAYAKDRIRGNFALMTGTYTQANLAGEPSSLRPLYEGNIGYKVSKKHNLWLDMGILPSHIGFESAVGKDCWTLSRSLVAENSPYYESGARLGFTAANEKWYAAMLFLNGWQRIQSVPSATGPSIGTQITFHPNAKYTFNWSTYVGAEYTDIAESIRVFNNFYATAQFTDFWAVTAGVDYGLQQRKPINVENWLYWGGAVLISRFNISEKSNIAARIEHYLDPQNIIVASPYANQGYRTSGFSLNYDYRPSEQSILRFELRSLVDPNRVFLSKSGLSSNNLAATVSFGLSF